MKYERAETKVIYCIITLVSVFFILPFILFGEDSIVTIHDNLDPLISYYRMYKSNGLFFKFNAPTSGFSEMSTLYYGHVNFTFTPLLFQIFDDFIAYALNYYLSVLIGFFSMHLLLKKMKISPSLAVLVSMCYSLLPVVSTHSIAVSTLPLIIYIFFWFTFNKSAGISWKVFPLLFFPFFSHFTFVGIFILGFWLLGVIILWVKNRKINFNLVIAFFMLCLGTVLTDLRLFYVMFVLKTPLNRSVITITQNNTIPRIEVFLRGLINYGVNGFYHASSFQKKIIVPCAFFTSLVCLVILIGKIRKPQGKSLPRGKALIPEGTPPPPQARITGSSGILTPSARITLLFLLEIVVFLICCIAALYDSGAINGFVSKHIPLLSGFNWGRVWVINRVLWYIISALCLQLIFEADITALNARIGKVIKRAAAPSFLPRLCALVLVCLQLGYILFTPTYYNDQIKTWFNEIAIKTDISKKMFPDKDFDSFISYNEFFAKRQFDKIKNDISYSGEPVAAFGYHPSVLMYNGFNCIDGYNNAYPLSYMRRFRTLIAPELEINPSAREYYDSWGGRMYLYNAHLGFEPTRNKNTSPVELNIDMDVFKNNFGGLYILSRTEISNSDDMGLMLVNRYYDDESIYTIYLYKAH